MSLEDFKEVFRVVLGIDNVDKQIERLFMKIDTSSDGYIDWDEFCSYMQLEYAEKEAVNRRAMEVQFELPVSQPWLRGCLRPRTLQNLVPGRFTTSLRQTIWDTGILK